MKDDEIHWGVRITCTNGYSFLASNGEGATALFKRRRGALEFIQKLASPISTTNPHSHISRRRMTSVKLRVRIEDA